MENNQPVSAPEPMSRDQAVDALLNDPVSFVRDIVAQSAQQHLGDIRQSLGNMREETELRAALNAFRKADPGFEQFQPFIMQELMTLIHNDPDGVHAPWDQLLEKAVANFRQKFQGKIEDELLRQQAGAPPPYIEGSANRTPSPEPPSFSRKQIAKMSMDDFLKNEAAINAAMTSQRIR
jgi:hypothetical protein